jgi:hypothetical protein
MKKMTTKNDLGSPAVAASAGKGTAADLQPAWRLERKADGDRFDDWSLDASGSVWFSKVVENDSDIAAIVCAGTERGLKRRERLILAAPHLLSALQGLFDAAEEVAAAETDLYEDEAECAEAVRKARAKDDKAWKAARAALSKTGG